MWSSRCTLAPARCQVLSLCEFYGTSLQLKPTLNLISFVQRIYFLSVVFCMIRALLHIFHFMCSIIIHVHTAMVESGWLTLPSPQHFFKNVTLCHSLLESMFALNSHWNCPNALIKNTFSNYRTLVSCQALPLLLQRWQFAWCFSRMNWFMPVVPALRRLRKLNCSEFEAILDYRPCLQRNK